MATVKVRVKQFVDPIEVDEAEIPSLRQQGLLVDEREALEARRDALKAELAGVEDELKALAPADAGSGQPAGGEPAAPAGDAAASATARGKKGA